MASAETLANALGGHKAGTGWIARCPAHQDRNPSLSICDSGDGKVLVRCHTGCGQQQVISALKSRGLWTDNGSSRPRFLRQRAPEVKDDTARIESALRVWRSTVPAMGTPVETYLRSRAITLPPPSTLRFARLRHPAGGYHPVMIALVVGGIDGAPRAVHRTYLAPDGSAKASTEPNKMMLGPTAGGAVRLAPAGKRLLVGEGIETCLSAMQETGIPAWAALSTAGLKSLRLPSNVMEVILLADGDPAGEAAALAAGMRWKGEGRRARIARPPSGNDFNDTLRGMT